MVVVGATVVDVVVAATVAVVTLRAGEVVAVGSAVDSAGATTGVVAAGAVVVCDDATVVVVAGGTTVDVVDEGAATVVVVAGATVDEVVVVGAIVVVVDEVVVVGAIVVVVDEVVVDVEEVVDVGSLTGAFTTAIVIVWSDASATFVTDHDDVFTTNMEFCMYVPTYSLPPVEFVATPHGRLDSPTVRNEVRLTRSITSILLLRSEATYATVADGFSVTPIGFVPVATWPSSVNVASSMIETL